jgi:hypothetical protein
VKDKIDGLSAMKKLPKDMDKAKLEAAKTTLADIQKATDDAIATFKSGNLTDAVAKGNAVKAKVVETLAALGVAPAAPAAAAK